MEQRYTTRAVATRQELKTFAEFGNKHYEGCSCYVPELVADTINTFDPKKNPALAFAEVQPFLCLDAAGNAVGRVAAIINRRANEKWGTQVVRFGMLDFIDDKTVSRALLDAVAAWGRAQGMTLMQGPLGITDFDKEGMLMEDYDRMASMVELYNYDYYPRHMEHLGFEKAVDWVQMRFEIPSELPKRYVHAAEMAQKMFGVKVVTVKSRDILGKGYGLKIFHLMNECYRELFGFTEFTDEQAMTYIKEYLSLADMDLVPIILNEAGEMVGACVTIGNLSHALRRAGGRLLPLGWWHLLRAIKWKREDTVELLLIGICPDYQGLGLNGLFFSHLLPRYQRLGFRYAETGPQLEDNIKELSQWRYMNPETIKRRRCWQKLVDG